MTHDELDAVIKKAKLGNRTIKRLHKALDEQNSPSKTASATKGRSKLKGHGAPSQDVTRPEAL